MSLAEDLVASAIGIVLKAASGDGRTAARHATAAGSTLFAGACPLCTAPIRVPDTNPGNEWVCQSCARSLGWDGCTTTITRTLKVCMSVEASQ
mgnify:CR=1 FL=1